MNQEIELSYRLLPIAYFSTNPKLLEYVLKLINTCFVGFYSI